MPRLVIVMEGGIIQCMMTDSKKPIDAVIVDRDTEGLDLSELTDVNGREAYVTDWGTVSEDPEKTEQYFKEAGV